MSLRSSPLEEAGDVFPGATPASAIAIGTLTETARDILEGAFIPLWVRGEVTDFKAHRNGHWYFALRDRNAQIRCVVWSRDRRGIPAAPDNGMQVAALGRLTVYPARGEMQFAVSRMEAEGDGLRRKALEKIKRRLEADGLLAPERKRRLPPLPRVIGVVTSPDGAALRDIIAVARRRAANVRIVLVPATVQGDNATVDLCRAIERISRWGEADVVIVGRGGGAGEDLWAFNDERVARTLAACRVPTISAVGHEVDLTICDLVADHRAPTPSAAAEAATASGAQLAASISQSGSRITNGIRAIVRRDQARTTMASRAMSGGAQRLVARSRSAIEGIAARLNALSPVGTLARGYSVARRDGRTLSSVADFPPETAFDLVVRDGTVPARSVG